ncbi:hypothetical protein T03_965 [Trichinella britovi]|uniref:ShKT domain-containing protein n=2 Tax=Trichinella TaxID=6333 RepID=A0A0V1DIJ8_TRIBR|nr:hypothetical protein T05_4265 [Trichinella murrelli]KRX60754.1 hypothetical protein T09_15797 [Trichinella sp. T9]KRY61327.1 hypothetical protein T03_965 [Trichinella britovi]KRZ98158.1 hypothetical protein T08_12694 [Trichinella sp. T8]
MIFQPSLIFISLTILFLNVSDAKRDPLPCVDTDEETCNQLAALKHEFSKKGCKEDRYFSRFVCCASCTRLWKIKVDSNGVFEDTKDLKFNDPTCPDVQDRVKHCEERIEYSPGYCDRRIGHYNCAKTCDVACV